MSNERKFDPVAENMHPMTGLSLAPIIGRDKLVVGHHFRSMVTPLKEIFLRTEDMKCDPRSLSGHRATAKLIVAIMVWFFEDRVRAMRASFDDMRERILLGTMPERMVEAMYNNEVSVIQGVVTLWLLHRQKGETEHDLLQLEVVYQPMPIDNITAIVSTEERKVLTVDGSEDVVGVTIEDAVRSALEYNKETLDAIGGDWRVVGAQGFSPTEVTHEDTGEKGVMIDVSTVLPIGDSQSLVSDADIHIGTLTSLVFVKDDKGVPVVPEYDEGEDGYQHLTGSGVSSLENLVDHARKEADRTFATDVKSARAEGVEWGEAQTAHVKNLARSQYCAVWALKSARDFLHK